MKVEIDIVDGKVEISLEEFIKLVNNSCSDKKIEPKQKKIVDYDYEDVVEVKKQENNRGRFGNRNRFGQRNYTKADVRVIVSYCKEHLADNKIEDIAKVIINENDRFKHRTIKGVMTKISKLISANKIKIHNRKIIRRMKKSKIVRAKWTQDEVDIINGEYNKFKSQNNDNVPFTRLLEKLYKLFSYRTKGAVSFMFYDLKRKNILKLDNEPIVTQMDNIKVKGSFDGRNW